MVPQSWAFEHSVPNWWHHCGCFRCHSLARGSSSRVEALHHLQFTLLASAEDVSTQRPALVAIPRQWILSLWNQKKPR